MGTHEATFPSNLKQLTNGWYVGLEISSHFYCSDESDLLDIILVGCVGKFGHSITPS